MSASTHEPTLSLSTTPKKRPALLCRDCLDLNLPELLSPANMTESFEFWFGIFQTDEEGSKNCPMCLLLRSLLDRGLYGTQRVSFSGQKHDVMFESVPSIQSTAATFAYLYYGRYLKAKKSGYVTELNPTMLAQILDNRINFDKLRHWIRECHQQHRHPVDSQPVEGMKLIDVNTRRIIKASPSFKYAALSYVWGAGPGPTLAFGELPEHLPRTIDDSLSVASELGIRYLWVDRYCVPQDHGAEKMSQIHKMHVIYQNAYITFFAVAGDGPDYGLPGVSRPRPPPVHCMLDGRLFVAVPHHPRKDILGSTWASRAWTYQEAVMSTRRLLFLENRILFECDAHKLGAIGESIRNSSCGPLPTDWRGVGNNPSVYICPPREPHKLDADLAFHIKQLTFRKTTDDGDALNVALGIFGYLRDRGLLMGHIYGVPIPVNGGSFGTPECSWEESFLSWLLWSSGGSGRRLTGFPSWSWTGWRGPCSRDEMEPLPFSGDRIEISMELDEKFLVEDSLREWQCTNDPHGPAVVPIQHFAKTLLKHPHLAFAVRYLHIKAPVLYFSFDANWKKLSYVDEDCFHHRAATTPDFELNFNKYPTNSTSRIWKGLIFHGFRSTKEESVCILLVEDFGDHVERFADCYMSSTSDLLFIPKICVYGGYDRHVFWHGWSHAKLVDARIETVRLG